MYNVPPEDTWSTAILSVCASTKYSAIFAGRNMLEAVAVGLDPMPPSQSTVPTRRTTSAPIGAAVAAEDDPMARVWVVPGLMAGNDARFRPAVFMARYPSVRTEYHTVTMAVPLPAANAAVAFLISRPRLIAVWRSMAALVLGPRYCTSSAAA